QYADVGCDQIIFGVLAWAQPQEVARRSVELFGQHVIPRFDRDPVHRTVRMRERAAGGNGRGSTPSRSGPPGGSPPACPPPRARRIVPPGRLATGMQLPVAAQSTVFAAAWEAHAGPAELLRVAQACDRAGFFYVAVCDHVAIPRSHAATMSTTWYDAVATLGWLAAATRSVRLLSYVYVAAYRHPLQ